ncbi:GMC oxidoreductase [Karstenula rhodostoma CBS 690.94]|uniref:GMC oxidoreductase n=1 Tax=Karstenula rhodostoma CBS 690.94 TaxID=1392251 RepID=A0A9P4PLR4_9PLEO|nr:GMC oxidoreductase [Karstenula rhodostoma CBS 690.94]
MAPVLTLVSSLAYLALFCLSSAAPPDINKKTYEYIVVGSGPGGGPLAANLARAGHSVLLLEAGEDQTENLNVSQWVNFNAAGNDPATRWDFFVKHSDDAAREARYLHRTWKKADGSFYVGTDPPTGAKPLGIYYPRAGTLGGCAMHNGCLTMNPNDVDWNDIAETTGDESWSAENMRKYLVKLEKAHYNSSYVHGHDGWLDTTMLDSGYAGFEDARELTTLAAQAAGYKTSDTISLLARDMNGNQANRDNLVGPFGGVSHINPNGRRSSPGYYVRDTVAENKFPLTLSLDTLATKIIFKSTGTAPRKKAAGVEYLQGKSLYSADPRSNANITGRPGKVYASREVIISGGAFNTPQLLLLSGIGPRKQLEKFKIPVIADLPGVGQQVADNYEAGILSLAKRDVNVGHNIFPNFFKSSVGKIRDIYMWCGNFAFEGFWPGFPNIPEKNFTGDYGPREYECALVHMNPRSQAGTIELQSTNPRDVPAINLNFFKNGAEQDLTAILEGVKWVRSWLSKVNASETDSLAPFQEKHPCEGTIGKQNCTAAAQKTYIKEQAYSHHASSSARIGADDDRFAVLDSEFKVRKVVGLRVVDASSFPKVPGAFPVLPTMMISEKATDVILEGLADEQWTKD